MILNFEVELKEIDRGRIVLMDKSNNVRFLLVGKADGWLYEYLAGKLRVETKQPKCENKE